ncbi:MAG: phosphoribosylanthranilate isomerase [Lysobacter sp.]|nr:phosphoribosylanthranilate isomerase [Lysobacter sp.]
MSRTLFRTRIKFCGMTRAGDVRLASELGVDAVGFVFAEGSPRRLEPEEARVLRNAMEPLVDAVALFKDNPIEDVRAVVKQVRPSLLQFHGSEDDAFCRGFGIPYIKGIPMRGLDPADRAIQATQLQMRYPGAAAFLFDGHAEGQPGGTGQIFDWSTIPTGLGKPFVLAGGIRPDNVFDAVISTLPWGVDVASGIETAPGIKDGDKMRRFVEEVRRADCHPD